MKLSEIIVKLFITVMILGFLYFWYNAINSQPKNIDKIYPDSIQVLTITGDTATIYGMSGHRMLIIRNPKSK